MKGVKRVITHIAWCMALLTIFISCKEKSKVSGNVKSTGVAVNQDTLESVVLSELDTSLYYHRGACFGMCPMFTLVVYQNGRASYEGRNHVDRIGFYQTTISEREINSIREVAGKIGYFEMQEVYDNPHVTDLPMNKTAVSLNGKLKHVNARYKAPPGLQKLYAAMDTMIEAQTWMPSGK